MLLILFNLYFLLGTGILPHAAFAGLAATSKQGHFNSPLHLHLPDCDNPANYINLEKKTKAKGIICPLFRDEEGFLSEFVAYYQMHGIDHIRFYNHNSTDRSLDEIQPWIDSGFVSVESNIDIILKDNKNIQKLGTFNYMMYVKSQLEKHCKKWAQDNGYDFFFSVDVDEYLMPVKPKVTIMDTIYQISEESQRSIFHAEKLNFQQAPYSIEPIELLTIEAYQVRNDPPSKMTHFKTVHNKIILRLNHSSFTDSHRKYVVDCCDFHGCRVSGQCNIDGLDFLFKGKKKFGHLGLQIMHYSRSLEKFALKSKTWITASGDGGGSSNYHLGHFLERQVGSTFDNRAAVRYGCQMRNILRDMSKEEKYLRPGKFWYRNVVHGKPMTDGAKGRRYGHPIQKGFHYHESNKNLYMGSYRISKKGHKKAFLG